jgi:cell division septum initiation protein DivIVA
VSDEPSTSHPDQPPPAAHEQEQQGFGDLRHYVPADLLNPSFPIAVRGYSRESVEAYVKRANRVIAELKVSASPRAAVTHALEQTEEQVSGLLQRARETGEEITASARTEADEIVAQAKAEAADLLVNVSTEADSVKAEADQVLADARKQAEDLLARTRLEAESTRAKAAEEAEQRRSRLDEELASSREQAEARMRVLQDDTGEVWADRDRLLVDVRRMASELLALADGAAVRHEHEEQAEPESVDEVERAGAEVSPDAPTEIRKPKRAARTS